MQILETGQVNIVALVLQWIHQGGDLQKSLVEEIQRTLGSSLVYRIVAKMKPEWSWSTGPNIACISSSCWTWWSTWYRPRFVVIWYANSNDGQSIHWYYNTWFHWTLSRVPSTHFYECHKFCSLEACVFFSKRADEIAFYWYAQKKTILYWI